jgi:hypothetical protein
MAITRTQIAKQLLAQGGRTGFQGGGADLGTASSKDFGFGDRDARDDRAIEERMRNIGKDSPITPPPKPPKTKDNFIQPSKFFTPTTAILNFIGEKFSGSKLAMLNNALQRNNYLATLTPDEQVETLEDLAAIGIGTDNPMGIDRNIERGMEDRGILGTGIGGNKFITDPDFGGPEAKAILGEGYENYLEKQRDRFTTDDRGGEPPIIPIIPQTIPSTTKEEEDTFIPNFRLLSEGGRAGLAEGGMSYEGGIMDLESARQMYGLGKLVKKVTRTIKKIAKSPLGKAAILGAGTYFGLGKFGATKDLGLLAKLGIAGTTAALPFLTKEEEEDSLYAGADIADPRFIMANPQRFQNIRTMAEGGSTEKEPVAKKTMPLLDMGGQEMDLRAEGGFVPIGRMEKADDVPARLSKNEFVFTADAVRNAGDGDVDKGAEVMYNMMKNLEAGGNVSEESQGLEGARKMFQTSQRLEEVL